MTCKKCSGSGRLPFIRPDGTISKSAVVYCDCYIQDDGYRPPIEPDDIDFPISNTWRDYYLKQEPLPETLQEATRPIEPSIGSRQLDHIQGELKYLHQKMTGLRAEKKSNKEPSKYS